MENDPKVNLLPSSIETIDAAFYDYVENLNLFCNTINGFEKVPIIWASAERAFQIKNNKQLRDKNGSLIPPIISIERSNTTKDPQKKGSFQANVSPKNDRFYITKIINQDKTANFANSDSLRERGQVNFITSKKNKKIVYKYQEVLIPIYITVEYKINILTNYQTQMNEIIQPFMSRVAQNYFLINKDGHRYECFMDQNFQQDSIANLAEEERKYKSVITVKVLGYLIGEGVNQEKPQVIERENAVDIKFPKENSILFSEPDQKDKKRKISNVTPVSTGVIVKKTFLIGGGTNPVYTVIHGFGSRDIVIYIRENFAPYGLITAAIDYSEMDSVDINMGDPVPDNSYSVTILG